MNNAYKIYVNEELVASPTSIVQAQAAWHRYSRDRQAAQHGERVVLEKDGRIIADVDAKTGIGHPWPDGDAVNLRDAMQALFSLLRHAGVTDEDLSEALGAAGLPTSRARLKSMVTLQDGKRAAVCPAEIAAVCYAGISVIKGKD